MAKTLTAVITSYGYRDYIAQAIDSVLSQTIMPDEILVVDDGAHDGACEVGQKFGLKTIERPENWGILKNYNDLLANHIKTDMVFVLAADDWINPMYIEKMNIDADIISCDITLVGHDVKRISNRNKTEFIDGYNIWRFKPVPEDLYVKNYIHGSSIYNVEIAKKFGYMGIHGRTSGRRLAEDWVLFRRMIRHGGARHVHITEPLLYYRKHQHNINGTY